MVYFEIFKMIDANYNINFPETRSHEELEAQLRKRYPGIRLLKDHYNNFSREWNYDIYFDHEKDLAWFLLKLKSKTL